MPGQVQQLNPVVWLIMSGGAPLLVAGGVLAFLALILCILPHRKLAVLMLCLSLGPAMLSIAAVYTGATEYIALAASPEPPKPAVLGQVVGTTLSYAFCGLVGTVLPSICSIVSLVRSHSRRFKTDGQASSNFTDHE
ncbi:hypothetical protein [Rubinisphaera margarita]|uniref:hypothetical protein n=1 Tax=Rubinisphaera margarita TaxID=2909586 RepID=UPI001EE86DFE|nr:hypothetical protein [Rubinisphaera margarita]MCG6157341.1 hypothetical protein [Rubinisphaera margarita]